jgi:transcriptional regulator with XRE-family HTH domain
MKSLGTVIHEARKQHGKTLQVVSGKVGVSVALLSLTEQDNYVPKPDVIVKLAELLGGDADQWCGLAGKLTPKAEKFFAMIARDDPAAYRLLLKLRAKKDA